MSEENNESEPQNYQKPASRVGLLSIATLSPGLQWVFLMVCSLFSAIIFTVIGSLVSAVIFDVSILDNPDIMARIDDPNVLSSLKFMQILQHIGLFILPAGLFAYLVSQKPMEYLNLNKSALPISYLSASLVMFLALPVINWMIMVNELLVLPDALAGLEMWMKQAEESAIVITEKFLTMNTRGDLAVNLLMIAIIPALGEELLFRGVLQRIFINWTKNIHWGIWISAILFSALHMQFYGFLPRMMLGVLFGYLLVWSGSLLLPMLCHLVNNGSAVIFAYVTGANELALQDDSLGTTSDDTLLTLGCSITLAGFLYIIYKKEKGKIEA